VPEELKIIAKQTMSGVNNIIKKGIAKTFNKFP